VSERFRQASGLKVFCAPAAKESAPAVDSYFAIPARPHLDITLLSFDINIFFFGFYSSSILFSLAAIRHLRSSRPDLPVLFPLG
jgi:hypothetical protein